MVVVSLKQHFGCIVQEENVKKLLITNLGNPLPQNGQNLRDPGIRPFYEFGSTALAVRVIEGHLEGSALDADGGVRGGMGDRVGPNDQSSVGLKHRDRSILGSLWIKAPAG